MATTESVVIEGAYVDRLVPYSSTTGLPDVSPEREGEIVVTHDSTQTNQTTLWVVVKQSGNLTWASVPLTYPIV